MAEAAPATQEDFEIEGRSELSFCSSGCTARFRARSDEIRVFCGADADADMARLDSYADLLFGTQPSAVGAGFLTNPPHAMLEALTLPKGSVAEQEFRPQA